MVREFKILVDIWGPPDKEGKSKIIKKNILKRKSINLHDITSIEELTSDKGKILKNICMIECGEKQIVVKTSYSNIYNMVSRFNTNKPIGFRYKNRTL